MSKKRNTKYISGRAYSVGIIFCFGIAFSAIIYISYINPLIRLEHFSFLFGMIGSLATAFTLYLLMVQYGQSQSEKIENENRKQAENISAWISIEEKIHSSGHFKTKRKTIVLSNKSNLPIYNVVVSIVDGRHSDADGKNVPKEFQRYIHIVPPGDGIIIAPHGYQGMNFVGAVEIGFEDSGNRSWVRRGNGRLEKIAEDTFEYYKVASPPSYDDVQKME